MKILCLDCNRPLRPRTCKEEEETSKKDAHLYCVIKQNQGNVLGPHYNKVYECYISIMTFIYYVKMRVTNIKKYC
jgi:hypothetical protein